jgi:uncharacterized protein
MRKHERPHSEDPDFWDVWTGKDKDSNPVERNVDWQKIANDWQSKTNTTSSKAKQAAKKV